MGFFIWSYKARCLAILFVAWAVGYADRILMSIAIVPIRTEFQLNAAQGGLVLSAFYFSYAAMQLVGGWMADRFGSRAVIVASVAAWSIFTGFTSLAWSFISLLVIRLLFGAGEGSFSPASSVTIAETFPKEERARAKSFLISTIFIGNAVGAAIVGGTIAWLGWRASFHILAAAGVVVVLALLIILRPPRSHAERKVSGEAWSVLLRMSLMWKLTAIWFFTSMLYVGIQSWMPSYLLKAYGIDLAGAGLATLIPNAFAFVGANVVGTLLDRFGEGKERWFMALGAGCSAAFLALMMTTTILWLLIVYWTLCLLAFNFVYSTVFSAPLRHFPENLIGSAAGLMNFGGQIAGSIAPLAMGGLIYASGGSYLGAFALLVGSAAAAAAIALTWKQPRQFPPEPFLARS